MRDLALALILALGAFAFGVVVGFDIPRSDADLVIIACQPVVSPLENPTK